MSIALENRVRALEIRIAELEHKLTAQNNTPKFPIPPPPVLPNMKSGKQHNG